jgi:hypothetical protein
VSKDSGQTETAPRKFKLGPLANQTPKQLTRDNRVSSGWSKLAFRGRGVLIESAASIRITHLPAPGLNEMSVIVRVMADRQRVTRGDPKRLEHFGFKVYSQSDEDGIITEIFRRIGTANRVFVELGAETGMENNSRLLLEQGWSGLWIEGVPDYGGAIRWQYRDELAEGRLKFIEQYVDRDNINDLIRSVEISGEIDFLSIDIDGNDYHVFEAIKVICPRVVCLKHNHCYPPPAHWVMPYNPAYRWHAGKTDFGASICALHRLARRKGYELVGCGLYSANGFYVRSDLIGPWYKRRFRRPRKPGQFFNDLNYEMVLKFPVGRDIWPKR